MDEKNLDIENILAKLSRKILRVEEVSLILNNPVDFPTELVENLALITAIRYWNNEINFEDGDCIINNVYRFWWTNDFYVGNYPFSEIAWECYEAFDAGEYPRTNDDKTIDPAEKYTRPFIEDMLKKRNLI
ncbi:hypothetical protein [Pedobacter frigiditerrae]|uniref:hypothetical protein n=1 Tax=Pedobacter frigiditerrae TaxID=2530452 RepID=UPI002931DBC4|nr:hypothetical protein [Pedobacter frigiditerrae]